MASFYILLPTKPLDKIFHKDMLIVRIVKYKIILTNEGKAVLEKEMSVNCPEVDKTMNSPYKLEKLATHF